MKMGMYSWSFPLTTDVEFFPKLDFFFDLEKNSGWIVNYHTSFIGFRKIKYSTFAS